MIHYLKKINNSTLGRRIFFRSIGVLIIVTLFSLIIQLTLNLKERDSIRISQLEEFISSVKPYIKKAIWELDGNTLDLLTETIASREDVQYANIKVESLFVSLNFLHGEVLSTDKQSCYKIITRDYSKSKYKDTILGSGNLEVCYLGYKLNEIFLSFFKSTLPQLANIFIIAFLFLMLLLKTVVEPISALIDNLKAGTSILDFNNKRSLFDTGDEIDLLVSELKEKSKQLKLEQDITNTAFVNISDGIAVTDSTFKILRVNTSFKKLMLNNEDKNIDSEFTIHDLVPAHHLTELTKGFEFTNKKGNLVQLVGTPVTITDLISGYVIVAHDLTELRRVYMENLKTQKLNALGILSSGLAHDFNNQLHIILFNLESLVNNSEVSTILNRETLSKAHHAANTAAKLAEKILTYSRNREFKKEVLDPNKILIEMQPLCANVAGTAVNFKLITKAKKFIELDQTYLETAILNLIINSADAVDDGGEIILSVSDTVEDGKYYVLFAVEDNGTGISEDILDNIVSPFLTTKPGGTGLGLTMVKWFAEQFGGYLKFESNRKQGAKFMILLPATEKKPQAKLDNDHFKDEDEKKIQTLNKKLEILIVEDQQLVAETIAMQLHELGHNSFIMDSLDTVKTLSLNKLLFFDLVICDFSLRGHSAIDVTIYFQQNEINAPFLIVTGNLHKFEEYDFTNLDVATMGLAKPFTIQELDDAIHKLTQ